MNSDPFSNFVAIPYKDFSVTKLHTYHTKMRIRNINCSKKENDKYNGLDLLFTNSMINQKKFRLNKSFPKNNLFSMINVSSIF